MKYKRNETMEMLGKQHVLMIFERDEIYISFKETFEANMNDNPIINTSAGIDFFMLGYIWGKRDMRAKRKLRL
jgi:hypothetical protein